jgi:hypothetical protein
VLRRLWRIADDDVHLGKIAGGVDLIRNLPRCCPDEEIGGYALFHRLDKYLVVMPLNLDRVRIGYCDRDNGFGEIDHREVIERRLDVLNLVEVGGLCRCSDGGKSENCSQN